MQQIGAVQSIIDTRGSKASNQSIIDNRVASMHQKLTDMLHDTTYDIGYTFKIAKRFSEADIYGVAEYCARKANKPGRAFVSIMEKKLRA